VSECGFDADWAGKCKEPKVEGEPSCARHLEKRCMVKARPLVADGEDNVTDWGDCGKPARSSCAFASSLVCGYLRCDEHSKAEHWGHK